MKLHKVIGKMYFIDKLQFLFNHCFEHFHHTKFLAYCFIIFVASIASYYSLLKIKRSENKYFSNSLRKLFFISADKSETNAIQVGGIPFAIISILSIGLLFYWFPYLITAAQRKLLFCASFTWAGIIVYGYIDDFFEIRPIVKLSFQVLIVSIFCINAAELIYPAHSAYAFVVMLFLSIAVLNGTNLMDGLDTLSFKISSVIYFSYIILASSVTNLSTLFIATSCFFIMLGFYFFNREPSKIHLGEVGVGCLGFSYIVLSVLTLNSYKHLPIPYSASKALLPLVFPIIELAISFTRRILNGKSPLKGDKLHVHHILHEVHNQSASFSSTIISGSYLIMIMISFILMDKFTSLSSIIVLPILVILWALGIGYKLWFKNHIKINIFHTFLVKKDVTIISSNALSDFRIIVKKTNKSVKDEDF